MDLLKLRRNLTNSNVTERIALKYPNLNFEQRGTVIGVAVLIKVVLSGLKSQRYQLMMLLQTGDEVYSLFKSKSYCSRNNIDKCTINEYVEQRFSISSDVFSNDPTEEIKQISELNDRLAEQVGRIFKIATVGVRTNIFDLTDDDEEMEEPQQSSTMTSGSLSVPAVQIDSQSTKESSTTIRSDVAVSKPPTVLSSGKNAAILDELTKTLKGLKPNTSNNRAEEYRRMKMEEEQHYDN